MDIYKNIDDEKYSFELDTGNVYLVLTSLLNIHREIFNDITNVKFINSPFENAIKIDPYIEVNKISKKSIAELQSFYDFKLPNINSYGILNRLTFIILKQLLESEFLVIELAGLGNDSIIELQKRALLFITSNPNKIIVFVDNLNSGKFSLIKLG